MTVRTRSESSVLTPNSMAIRNYLTPLSITFLTHEIAVMTLHHRIGRLSQIMYISLLNTTLIILSKQSYANYKKTANDIESQGNGGSNEGIFQFLNNSQVFLLV